MGLRVLLIPAYTRANIKISPLVGSIFFGLGSILFLQSPEKWLRIGFLELISSTELVKSYPGEATAKY